MSYTYDADGHLATRVHGGVTDAFYWSALGQLDSVVSGTLHHWYEYNSFGQLVRRQTKMGSGGYSIDRYFLWDEHNLIAELSGTGTRIAQYIYTGTDQPFALATDSGGTSLVRYLYQDPTEGNLTGLMRDSLTLHQYTQYDAWGLLTARPINTVADTNRLGWKGLMYEGDSTKLYYMRNRWYDPAVGRFISEDPLGIAGGLNLYTFAGNDPINGTDPLGLNSFTPTLGCGFWRDLGVDILSLFTGGNYSCPPPVQVQHPLSPTNIHRPTPLPAFPASGCSNFNSIRCKQMWNAISQLNVTPDSLCQSFGEDADVRMVAGAIKYDSTLTVYGATSVNGTRATTRIGPQAFDNVVDTYLTLAHEEAHAVLGVGDGPNGIPDEYNPAEKQARACATAHGKF